MQQITAETPLSDRDLLIHVVQHVEHIDEMVTAVHDVLEAYKPLLARFAPGGGADYLTIMQTARDLRRAGRHR